MENDNQQNLIMCNTLSYDMIISGKSIAATSNKINHSI